MEYVNVKVKDVKVAEMNEVKSDEMVPDWLWGGEKHLSVIIIIIIIIVVIIIIIVVAIIIITIRGLSSATTSRWFRATVTGSLRPRASPGAASKQVIIVLVIFIIRQQLPLKLSSPGLFSPPMNETTGEKLSVGLRLPGLRLQVFEVPITVIVTQAGLVNATLACKHIC